MKKNLFFSFLLILLLHTSRLFPETPARPLVESLSAREENGKISLTWVLPQNFKAESILVYRDKKQISTVKNMFPIAQLLPLRTSFTDSPEHGISFFYCVLARDTSGNVFETIIPSVNATVSPVKIKPSETYTPEPEKSYESGNMRRVPLPYLDLSQDLRKKGNITNKNLLKAAKELSEIKNKPPKKGLEPYIFPEDSSASKTGDDYYLFQILKNSFLTEKYKKTADELNDFLGINRSEKTTARATFYLGESFYFLGDYKKAISHFLSVSDDFPELSRKWLDASLDLYELP